jgi:lysophospholipase
MCQVFEEVFICLLQQGADFSAENGDFRTPLHIACCGGNLEVVEFLLLSGASVHVKDRYSYLQVQEACRCPTVLS